MTDKQRKELLRSQQGELDAVLMYNALAKAVKREPDSATFKQLAKEEGRHAQVFHQYTQTALQPKTLKSRLLPMLYRLLGRRLLYPLIAKGEYKAEKGYQHLIADFSDVASVAADEKRHGDTVMSLLNEQ